MRFASVKPNHLAVVQDSQLVLVGDALAQEGVLPKNASMIDLISRYETLRPSLAKALEKGAAIPLDAKKLKAPVENPSKIWAAATNYKRGSEGLDRKSTRLNSSHSRASRMPSSA